MIGTAALRSTNSYNAQWNYAYGTASANANGEHDEWGDTAFYPLSPVHNELFYFFLPEAIGD